MSKEANIIYVGRKPVMNYVLAVVTIFNTSNAEEVTLKARGRAITTAVDVAEISTRRFIGDVKVDEILLGSEDIRIQEENRTKKVSTIDIRLKRFSSEEEKESKGSKPQKASKPKGKKASKAES